MHPARTGNPPPTRMVLLRHQLADGTVHFDWMIQRPGATGAAGGIGDDQRVLLTLRVHDRIDQGVQAFTAERIGDHRAAYLEFEGELSGNRGRVARVAAGEAHLLADHPAGIEIRGVFAGAPKARWIGTPTGDGTWRFRHEADG